jgi:acyl-coenzyme A synthetase/AMP-(fatty) acid ligase
MAADPDAPAVYFVSSGTTGAPKVFAMSQRTLAARAELMATSDWFGPEYRSLSLVPVEDSPGKNKRLNTTYLGATSVFQSDAISPPPSVQSLCAQARVTCLELSVLQLTSIVHDPSDTEPFPAETAVYVSGSRVPAQLRQAFERRFAAPLRVHYGARECGRISITGAGGRDHAIESVGTPVPWIDLEIVDGDGKALPAGETGELRIRWEHMTRSYHDDPVAMARHFRDGWFYPGDLASLSPQGMLRIDGRIDDMMNLNSIKIFPAEIERVLEEHPAVKGAAAFAKPSRVHGDIPVAAVELHESASVTSDELMARARKLLGVRAPRRIFLVDALPRTAAGKIAKQELLGLVGTDR